MITGVFMATLIVAAVAALFLFYRYVDEGFADLNVPADIFVPKVTPGGTEEVSALSPGGAADPNTEKLVANPGLPAMTISEADANFGQMTSQTCYKSDIGESLKKTRNYLQRTNNYVHKHPDSCSAPNHEFVGTFYNPFDGVGRNPPTGTSYPESTQCIGM